MELTREEAIRNFREHWASLAITGSNDKAEYLKRNGFENIAQDCFLCELTNQECNRCPIQWAEQLNEFGKMGRYYPPCVNSYFGSWVGAETSEERKRIAAIIRDLPEKEEPAPKFKVGDKVVPIGISWPGWTLDRFVNCKHFIPLFFKANGYLYVSKVQDGEYQYLCGTDNLQGQDRFKESDLIPYVEPPARKFKIGDIVTGNAESDRKYARTTSRMTKGEVVEIYEDGAIGVKILEHENFDYANNTIYDVGEKYFDLVVDGAAKETQTGQIKLQFKVGDMVKVLSNDNLYTTYSQFFESNDLLQYKAGFQYGRNIIIGDIYKIVAIGKHEYGYPLYILQADNGDIFLISENDSSRCLELVKTKPTNRCPENKTVKGKGITFIFNGPVTVCILDIDGKQFKGIAKCDPDDEWKESIGKTWAKLRATRKALDSAEEILRAM